MEQEAIFKEKELNRRLISTDPFGDSEGCVKFVPSYFQIEHTTRCNARCIMCNHFITGNRGARDIDARVIAALLDVMRGASTVMVNGDGEPFLFRNWERVLKRYRALELEIGANTNLCSVDEGSFYLIGEMFAFLNISCDGANKETFEGIRRGLSFDLFLRNFEKLNQAAPRVKKNLDCVLMMQNIHEVVDLVRLAASMDCASVKFHLMGVNPCLLNSADSVEANPGLLHQRITQAKEEAKRLGIAFVGPKANAPCNALVEESDSTTHPDFASLNQRQAKAIEMFPNLTLVNDYLSSRANAEIISNEAISSPSGCDWAVGRCYVDVSGNVSTCCYNTRFHMGNILDEGGFWEVWNGENYRALRREMASGRLPGYCSNCSYLRSESRTLHNGGEQ